MIIAIDGPAASGKGTLGKRLAAHYRLRHLDTGLIYRAVAQALLAAGLPLDDAARAAAAARALDPGSFDESALKRHSVGEAASVVSAIPEVRSAHLGAGVFSCGVAVEPPPGRNQNQPKQRDRVSHPSPSRAGAPTAAAADLSCPTAYIVRGVGRISRIFLTRPRGVKHLIETSPLLPLSLTEGRGRTPPGRSRFPGWARFPATGPELLGDTRYFTQTAGQEAEKNSAEC